MVISTFTQKKKNICLKWKHNFLCIAVRKTVSNIVSLFCPQATLKAASNLHNGLFVNIIHNPMSFFDTTPSGQILNRFSKDLDEGI